MEDGQMWCAGGPMCNVPSTKRGLQIRPDQKLCIGDACLGVNEFRNMSKGPGVNAVAAAVHSIASDGQHKVAAVNAAKPSGWHSAVNVIAPVQPESLYSLHFGDGKDLHGRQTGMGYIKDQPNRVFGNTRGTLGAHIHQDDDLHVYSSGWNPLFAVKGGSGNAFVRGDLQVQQGKVVVQDNIERPDGKMRISSQGIMFGGPNSGREHNSAQISAGKHIANSLNIVGMSANTSHTTRRIDMWAEGGLNVHGTTNHHGPTNFQGGKSAHNPHGWGTHFPWSGDQKNYIRGDTEIRGDTQQLGDLVVHGSIVFRHPNGTTWTMGMRDPNHFAINKVGGTGLLIRQDGHIWSGGGNFHQGSADRNWQRDWFHNSSYGRR